MGIVSRPVGKFWDKNKPTNINEILNAIDELCLEYILKDSYDFYENIDINKLNTFILKRRFVDINVRNSFNYLLPYELQRKLIKIALRTTNRAGLWRRGYYTKEDIIGICEELGFEVNVYNGFEVLAEPSLVGSAIKPQNILEAISLLYIEIINGGGEIPTNIGFDYETFPITLEGEVNDIEKSRLFELIQEIVELHVSVIII